MLEKFNKHFQQMFKCHLVHSVLGNSCVKIKKTMSGLSIITSRAGGTPPVEDICVWP